MARKIRFFHDQVRTWPPQRHITSVERVAWQLCSGQKTLVAALLGAHAAGPRGEESKNRKYPLPPR